MKSVIAIIVFSALCFVAAFFVIVSKADARAPLASELFSVGTSTPLNSASGGFTLLAEGSDPYFITSVQTSATAANSVQRQLRCDSTVLWTATMNTGVPVFFTFGSPVRCLGDIRMFLTYPDGDLRDMGMSVTGFTMSDEDFDSTAGAGASCGLSVDSPCIGEIRYRDWLFVQLWIVFLLAFVALGFFMSPMFGKYRK